MTFTVDDIARAAGVSRSTVLRALSDKAGINPKTKARVKQIAEQYRYRPNRIASNLARGESTFVGVAARPGDWASAALETIEPALRDAGYSMLFYTGYPGDERLCFEHLIQNRVAGVIAMPSSNTTDSEAYRELVDAGMKLVIIDRCIEGVRTPQVIGDDCRAAWLATEHLISQGHRRIAHLTTPMSSYSGRQREKGFQGALAAAKITVPVSAIIETPLDEQSGFQVMRSLLEGDEPPTAVVTHNDIVAIGAMLAIIAAGLSIPGDISLVGNGNIWCADALRVPLTSVRRGREMVEIGTRKLLAMLAGEQVEPEITVLDVDLVVRESCGPPRK